MGTEKAAMSLAGTSMLDRVIARIAPIASTVVLACGRAPVERPGALTVMDSGAGRGPLEGIVAALRVAPDDLCAVVAVDMPDLDPALLLALAARCGGHDAAVPLSDRGCEPLHAVYAPSALGGLRAALDSSDTSMRSALLRLRGCYADASQLGAAPGFARNLNTPDDVTAWLADPRASGRPPR